VVTLLLAGIGWLTFEWTVNRFYVEQGQSLQLRYKGPLLFGSAVEAPDGEFAEDGEIGVLEHMPGPGRHFYCPIWWKRELVNDIVVLPGEVGVVTSKLGGALAEGEFLVEGEIGQTKHRGIMRKVYGPGRYRVNPYAYEFKIVKTQVEKSALQEKHSGWVTIPSGKVGVVTYLADFPERNRRVGIQQDVLQPGIYPVNPREMQVDVVEVGYRETSIETEKMMRGSVIAKDESGEPIPDTKTGVDFPSDDGFRINMDFTAIWGISPEQAPQVVRTFGNVHAVEQKIIMPQAESICRNNGSKMKAVELLVGETRQHFQEAVTKEFHDLLAQKNLTLLYGLVRHIYIPQEVRIPIQNGYIADQLTLTRQQEGETAKTEATLREAEKKVELEAAKVKVETAKLVASVEAEGQKKAKETAAETQKLIAAIDKQVAELEAKKTVLLGTAKATADKMEQEARAEKFTLAVKAFGSGSAYTKWQFAEALPLDIALELFYAGEGTLWTDLKNIMPTLPIGPQAKTTGSEKSR
jgi:hypothetical protein